MKKQMKRLLSLGMSLTMAFTLLAGCGGGDSTPTPTPTPNAGGAPATSTPAPAPKYKDELNVAMNANPPSLDVHAVNSNIVGGVGMHIFEPLFSMDQNANTVPVLAESYEVSEDGKVYTIKIRQGVKFHNGQEMVADDVVASMTRWLEKSAKAAPLLGGSTFAKVDNYTITMTTPEAYADALSVLAGNIQFAAIMPKSVIDAATADGIGEYIGTGPYKLAEWKQDQYIHVTRYDDYQQPAGESSGFVGAKNAYTKDIYFRVVTDASTRIAGVQTGQYDVSEGIPLDRYAELAKDSKVVLSTKTAGTLNLFFNTTKGVMANEKIRDAIMLTLNCEDALLAAYGDPNLYILDPGWCSPSDAQWGSTAGSEVYNKADVAAAKKLMAEASYNNEEIVLVTTPDYPEMYNATLVVYQQLLEAGFNAVLEQYDFATFMNHRADPDQFSLFITGNSYNINPVQLAVLGSAWAGLEAPEVTNGIAAIRGAASEAEARQAWEDLQGFLYDYGAACVLGHYSGVIATTTGVEGFNYFNFPVYWNVKVAE